MTENEIVNILKESGALLTGHFQLRSGLQNIRFLLHQSAKLGVDGLAGLRQFHTLGVTVKNLHTQLFLKSGHHMGECRGGIRKFFCRTG